MATSMDKSISKKINDFQSEVAHVAQNVIFQDFPAKILHLQSLIDESQNESSHFYLLRTRESKTDLNVYRDEALDEPENKKRKLGDHEKPGAHGKAHIRYTEQVNTNERINTVHATIKGECEDLASLCDKVKLWVNLAMPKIEDGDNFGVQIQEEVLAEVHRAQESAYNLRDSARQNHINRAKICSKLIKYPNVEDYKDALKEHDDKQLYMARQHLHDLRNMYAVLMDIFHKNITKIRAPKGNNGASLY